jgi:hypothetical protein
MQVGDGLWIVEESGRDLIPGFFDSRNDGARFRRMLGNEPRHAEETDRQESR